MKIQATSRSIWSASYPIMLAGLGETIVEVTDTIFLGRYGGTELAAIGLADAIYGIAMFAALGLVDGIQIVIARRAGQERRHEIGEAFNHGLVLLAIAAVLLTAAIKILTPPLTRGILRSPEVAHAVDDFLQIFAWALVFHAGNLACSAFYVGISRTRALIGATAVLATVNIVVDYLLVFGHFGLPRLGIRGAALGSLAAEVAAFLFLVAFAIVRGDVREYGLFRLQRWNRALVGLLASISAPVAIDALVETVRWLLFFLILERLGADILARANIIYSCYTILLIPITGFAETTCSMVSNLIGQLRAEGIGGLLRRTTSLGLLAVVPLLVLPVFFPELVLSLFTTDPDTIAGCIGGLRVIALGMLIVIPAEMVGNAVAGTGDTPVVLWMEIAMTTTILVFTAVAGLALHLPLGILWMSEVAGSLVSLVISWAWLRSGRWSRLSI